MIKVFIDTNVIIHNLILSKIESEAEKNQRKDLWKRFAKLKPSYQLFEQIRNNKNENVQFLTSKLAISEIFYGLFEEYQCKKMRYDGVPLSSWLKVRQRFKLSNEDIKDIMSEFDAFVYYYIKGSEFPKESMIRLAEESYNFEEIAKLVTQIRLRTHDSVLLSTATTVDCKYFVTNDKELRQTKSDLNLEIISPQGFLQKLAKNEL